MITGILENIPGPWAKYDYPVLQTDPGQRLQHIGVSGFYIKQMDPLTTLSCTHQIKSMSISTWFFNFNVYTE